MTFLLEERPSLLVMGGDCWSRGCEFKSKQGSVSKIIHFKMVLLFKKTEVPKQL